MASMKASLLGFFFLCFHLGLIETADTVDASKISVDCSQLPDASKLTGMSITLPQDYKPLSIDNTCTFADGTDVSGAADPEKQYKVDQCDKASLLVIIVKVGDFDSNSKMYTGDKPAEFTISCKDGDKKLATASFQSATIPKIDVHPEVSLEILGNPPSATNVGIGSTDTKYPYGKDLYLTFEHKIVETEQLVLIPLTCSAKGTTAPEVTLFNINATQCILKPAVMKKLGENGNTFIKQAANDLNTRAVTYAMFQVFSFIEPASTGVTISCTVRVCDKAMTAAGVGGLCNTDLGKMTNCKSGAKRRRRDVKPLTRMTTSGQEHGQVHRVSTSYSIQDNFGITGGSSHISLTFSLLFLSFLALFL